MRRRSSIWDGLRALRFAIKITPGTVCPKIRPMLQGRRPLRWGQGESKLFHMLKIHYKDDHTAHILHNRGGGHERRVGCPMGIEKLW